MNKKEIKIRIVGGKIEFDFEGFEGKTCQQEEDLIRVILGRMGVETEIKHSDNKEAEEERHVATERAKNTN